MSWSSSDTLTPSLSRQAHMYIYYYNCVDSAYTCIYTMRALHCMCGHVIKQLQCLSVTVSHCCGAHPYTCTLYDACTPIVPQVAPLTVFCLYSLHSKNSYSHPMPETPQYVMQLQAAVQEMFRLL